MAKRLFVCSSILFVIVLIYMSYLSSSPIIIFLQCLKMPGLSRNIAISCTVDDADALICAEHSDVEQWVMRFGWGDEQKYWRDDDTSIALGLVTGSSSATGMAHADSPQPVTPKKELNALTGQHYVRSHFDKKACYQSGWGAACRASPGQSCDRIIAKVDEVCVSKLIIDCVMHVLKFIFQDTLIRRLYCLCVF